MTSKYRSFTITKGVPRSPNRSMLRAVGFRDEEFGKPHEFKLNAPRLHGYPY